MIYLTHKHYVKSVHIHCFSCPYFPAFALNTEQKNSKHGNFSCSGKNHQTMHFFWLMDQLPYLILTYFEDIKLFPVKKCFIIQQFFFLISCLMPSSAKLARVDKCHKWMFFWSALSHIRTEYGSLLFKSVRMKNGPQKLFIWKFFA